jgi:aspartyl-tRNA(Asn)/glutamyl-tRNA(Gln) amidotransferase subunit A
VTGQAGLPEVPTIAEAARLIAAKALSPVDLVDLCLRRIRALDSKLHSVLLVTEEDARAAAKRAEAEIAAGRSRGPLHGIPIGHKDIYETKGVRTTAHSRILAGHVPAEDAISVARLAEAGAVLLGKLATHEFAMGGPSFDLPWPPARNPWNTAHFTGGSSSGSGAAVAAGLVLGATGSDTGGSIRHPSAFCGIAGHKPTYGLVSRRGILPLAFSLDHAGPMAWTVEDCALLLQAMAGHDPGDPGSAEVAIPDYRASLRQDLEGVRVGVIRHFHEDDMPAEPEIRRAVDAAVAAMSGLGAEVREVRLPDLALFNACGLVILLAEAFSVHAASFRDRFQEYGEYFRDRVAVGALISGPDYVQAMRLRRQLTERTLAAMAGLDVLVTAAMPGPAPRIEAVEKFGTFKRTTYAIPFNVTGMPVTTVCCGFSSSGLPFGLQVIARPFADATALAVAHAYERASPWRARRPAP